MNQYLTGKYTYTYTSCKTTVHVPGTGTETPKTEMASNIPIGPGKTGQPWTNRNPGSNPVRFCAGGHVPSGDCR